MEKCENCGCAIGSLETPMVWGDRVVCGDCHGRLRGTPAAPMAMQVVIPHQKWSPSAAVLIGLVLPGGGQIYRGQAGTGIVLLISSIVGYILCIIPGLIIHIIAIISGAIGDTRKP